MGLQLLYVAEGHYIFSNKAIVIQNKFTVNELK